MKKVFGFIPELLIIEKVPGRNNTIVLSAVITDVELKAESNRKKNKRVADSPGKADSANAPDR